MELVANYISIDEERQAANLEGVYPEWREFQSSMDHKISVFAGRGTGKTYNLAYRAAHSDVDCMIFVTNYHSIELLVRQIQLIETDVPISSVTINRGSISNIVYENGRRIRIASLRNCSAYRGLRFNGEEVMFDEFEHSDFGEFMNQRMYIVNMARNIVCVGSINRREDTFAKQWLRQSDYYSFIDSSSPLNEYLHFPEEFTPSLMAPSIIFGSQ